MRKLGEQWVEEIDGKKHMVKAVKQTNKCSGCVFCTSIWCADHNQSERDFDCMTMIIKDLGVLNEDGLLPCPFCGEYPESFNKGNEYTKKRGSVLKCNKCHYELTVCAIYQTIEWCKEKVLYNWNRRV
jgi:Lar family restriction alleviation protein